MRQPDFTRHYSKPNLNGGETCSISVPSFKNLRHEYSCKSKVSSSQHHSLKCLYSSSARVQRISWSEPEYPRRSANTGGYTTATVSMPGRLASHSSPVRHSTSVFPPAGLPATSSTWLHIDTAVHAKMMQLPWKMLVCNVCHHLYSFLSAVTKWCARWLCQYNRYSVGKIFQNRMYISVRLIYYWAFEASGLSTFWLKIKCFNYLAATQGLYFYIDENDMK